MTEFRILVVDDHPITRHGLRTLLETRPGWRVCSEAATGHAALQKIKRLKPEIILLDLSLPDMNGLELIPKIIEVHREAAVLVLTEHESRQACSEAFTSGARGLVFKSDKLRDVIRGVHALTRGKHFCSPRVNELLKAQPGHSVESGTPAGPLTSREQQILRLLAEGKTNKDVAVALDLSVRTVEAHRASLMRKLNLHSLSDLIYFAIRYQIVKI